MKKANNLLLILILITAFIVRLYKLGSPLADWHSFRQADTSAVTRNFVKYGVNPLIPRYDDLSNIQSGKDNPEGYRMVEFPVYNLFHYGMYKSGLVTCSVLSVPCFSLEAAGRLTTVIASLFSLVFLYLIVKSFSGEVVAWLSAFIFAVLPYNVYYSRVVLPEPLAVTFSLGAIYFFMKSTQYRKLLITYYLLLITSAALAALALLTKPTAIFLLFPIAYLSSVKLIGVIQDRKLNLLKIGNLLLEFFLYLVIAFIPLLIWRLWISQFPEGIPAYSWLLWQDIKPWQPAWFRWLFYERLTKLILGGFGLVPLVLGIITRRGDTQELPHQLETSFYALWILGSLAYLIIFSTGNIRHDYYQILLVPIISIYFAKGLVALWTDTHFHHKISILTTVFLLLTSLTVSWYQIRGYYQVNNPAIVEAGQAADDLLPLDAKVIAPYFGDTAFLYQTNRTGWPLVTNYPIQAMIDRGATHYVSVTYDDFTKELMQVYPVIKQTEKYVIIQLTKNS